MGKGDVLTNQERIDILRERLESQTITLEKTRAMLETIVMHPATAFGKKRIWKLIDEVKAEQEQFERIFKPNVIEGGND